MMDNTKKEEYRLNFIIHIAVSVIVIVLAIGAAYLDQIKQFTYMDKSHIVSGSSLETVDKMLNETAITFIENDNSTKYNYQKLGIEYELPDEFVNKFKLKFFINLDKLDIEYNTDKLINELNKLNEGREKNQYNTIVLEDNKLSLVEEKQGNYLDTDKLSKDIIKKLGEYPLEFKLEDYYEEMDKDRDSKESLQSKIDKFNNFKITYTNGYELTGNDVIEYIKVVDNEILLNEELSKECFEHIDYLLETKIRSYDTVGGDWKFTTHGGKQINVKGGTWGDYYDSDKETEFIMEKLKTFESVENRVPIKSLDMADEIPDTYIEISLSEQHLWYYKDGKLVMDSKVVTGLKNRMDTPAGVYFISERVDGKYLTGDTYRTWVNKWLRITWRGHGLHDAAWRGSFGGKIYTYDGSHGCINLPKRFAYDLFEVARVNDCVVIY